MAWLGWIRLASIALTLSRLTGLAKQPCASARYVSVIACSTEGDTSITTGMEYVSGLALDLAQHFPAGTLRQGRVEQNHAGQIGPGPDLKAPTR